MHLILIFLMNSFTEYITFILWGFIYSCNTNIVVCSICWDTVYTCRCMILYTGWKETKNRRQEANMCQFLINTLEDDVFGLPLDHITGEAIAEGDPRSLKDLLEIFCEISEEFGRRSPLAGNSYMYINVWQLCVRYQTTLKHCGIIFQMATKYSGIKYQMTLQRFCVRYKKRYYTFLY